MNKSLFKIEQEYLSIAQQLIDNGGEVTEELQAAIAINEADLQTKSTNYSFVIKQMEGDVEIIDKEMARLTKLKKARNNSIERLESAIKQAMEFYQIEEIKTPLIKINFRKSKQVIVNDAKLLDTKYIKITTSESIDKVKIKEDIEAGLPVTGAVLQENKNIQIK